MNTSIKIPSESVQGFGKNLLAVSNQINVRKIGETISMILEIKIFKLNNVHFCWMP